MVEKGRGHFSSPWNGEHQYWHWERHVMGIAWLLGSKRARGQGAAGARQLLGQEAPSQASSIKLGWNHTASQASWPGMVSDIVFLYMGLRPRQRGLPKQ